MTDQEIQCPPVIVTLPAEIDLTSQDRIYDQIYALFASGAGVVVADFTATTFCDCSSLRRLIMIQDRAVARGAELRLAIPPGGPVRRLARLMDLDQVLPVYPSAHEAVTGVVTHLNGPGPDHSAAGRAASTADINDLMEASCLHIMRWQARLGAQHRHRGPVSGPELAAAWDTAAFLIDLHLSAEDEICGPAICGFAPQRQILFREVKESHEDIREIISETRFPPPGSPQWWRLTTTALSAWARQLDQEEHGLLAGCLRRARPAERYQLARQWRAFHEARIRDQDQYADAPPELPTCQLRLTHPGTPRLADPVFCPLACTCPACTRMLARVSLPGQGDPLVWAQTTSIPVQVFPAGS
jgi:anti-anti-sigma factor